MPVLVTSASPQSPASACRHPAHAQVAFGGLLLLACVDGGGRFRPARCRHGGGVSMVDAESPSPWDPALLPFRTMPVEPGTSLQASRKSQFVRSQQLEEGC
jgi:hypothetical protein